MPLFTQRVAKIFTLLELLLIFTMLQPLSQSILLGFYVTEQDNLCIIVKMNVVFLPIKIQKSVECMCLLHFNMTALNKTLKKQVFLV